VDAGAAAAPDTNTRLAWRMQWNSTGSAQAASAEGSNVVNPLNVPFGSLDGASPISVVALARYPSVRAGLRVLLEADQRCVVVGDGMDIASTIELLPLTPAVIVIDLPSLEGLDSIVEDAEEVPDAALVLLGPPPDDPRPLIRLGSRPWAYLPREADAHEIVSAVISVHSGLLVLDPAIALRLLAPGPLPRPSIDGDDIEDLTARELEVLGLLAEGIPNKAIARRLGISDHTVKFHVGSVLGKLGASSRTEAVRIGARRGLIAL